MANLEKNEALRLKYKKKRIEAIKTKYKLHKNWRHPSAMYITTKDECIPIEDWDALQLISDYGLAQPGTDRLRLLLSHTLDAAPLEQTGWVLIRETILRDVPLDQEPWAFLDNPKNLIQMPSNKTAPIWKDWVDAHWQYYKGTHLDNPVGKLSLKEMHREFAGSDLLPKHAVISQNSDGLTGFASLRTAENSDIPEAGWLWSVHGLPGLKPMWEWLTKQALASGFQAISLEADSTDPDLFALLHLLPSQNDEHFWTWEKRC